MDTNIQISLDEQLWSNIVRVGKPLGLEPVQVVQQALLGWLSQHDSQRFEQEWIAALQQNPDEASRAEDWLEAQDWSEI
ncbi:MAG TPA: hypothetical protein PLD20_03555 [Blastocatellia bacterium]|nr:hypothetical protein [Blastocatellia bacterium]HMX27268.1 hypothetical protein [Blastocatellia bacterium]HMY76330.1 hypothetical protein [Blastocatellia bacterium]HMZ16979.1 hypothetical protein [Blastocatellia bacterium]HNG30395.1 hypothetical protein [Blastocatellia bacterium]